MPSAVKGPGPPPPSQQCPPLLPISRSNPGYPCPPQAMRVARTAAQAMATGFSSCHTLDTVLPRVPESKHTGQEAGPCPVVQWNVGTRHTWGTLRTLGASSRWMQSRWRTPGESLFLRSSRERRLGPGVTMPRAEGTSGGTKPGNRVLVETRGRAWGEDVASQEIGGQGDKVGGHDEGPH